GAVELHRLQRLLEQRGHRRRAVAVFFFSSRGRHTRFSRDWSSDVCSSDLVLRPPARRPRQPDRGGGARALGDPRGRMTMRIRNGAEIPAGGEVEKPDLQEVLAHYGCHAPHDGKYLCLVHDEDNPSMNVQLDRGLWFCHSCGKGGDAYTLIMI